MSLHMLQMSPEMPHLTRWAHDQGVLPAREDDLGYALHAILHAAFGAVLAPKPFALVAPPRRAVHLLAYSAAPVAELRAYAAAFAEPAVHRALALDTLAAKPMPAAFSPGQRLGFVVRARPMLRTDRDGQRDRSREIDAFLAEVLRQPENHALDRATIYAAWLAERLRQGGTAPERVALASYRRTRVARRARGGDVRPLRLQDGPDVPFEGVLAVTDPDAFAGLLARGVGRHRAFGFGMLLLRPA